MIYYYVKLGGMIEMCQDGDGDKMEADHAFIISYINNFYWFINHLTDLELLLLLYV